MSYAPDGDLTKFSDDEIALGSMWHGDPHKLVTSLVACQLVDVQRGKRLVHDWGEYAGRLIEKRAANKERMRQARAVHVQCTYSARAGLPNRTEPNQPNRTDQDPPEAPQLAAAASSPFLATLFTGMSQAAFPGPITPHQANEAGAIEDEWTRRWGSVPPTAVGEYAIREAVDHSKRTWAYVRAILRSAFEAGGIVDKASASALPTARNSARLNADGSKYDPELERF